MNATAAAAALSSSTNNDETPKSNEDILTVLYDYTAKGDDELTLRRGVKLEVLSKDERISGSAGWWAGKLVDSESVGIFPASFVANSQPNLRIIDYNDLQIGEMIGVGGFGHVFYGKFGDIDVAIKTAKALTSFCPISTLTKSSTSGNTSPDNTKQTIIDSLLREARLFSNLKHRNIIQLHGVSPCLTTKNLYLVMEYAHGGPLSRLLQIRKSGLYPTVFIEYAKQIAEGMKYLHEDAGEHIIHRDLKCSNVLISEPLSDVYDDNDLVRKTLKITDFGLARNQMQSSSMSAAGTFAWMSPECIRNSVFSTKSDVWSFGVLLWECLTGEVPYKGFDQMQVAFGVATNKYSLPIPGTCPDEFSQLMKNCWQLLPQDRSTFAQLLEQIVTVTDSVYANIQTNDSELCDESYHTIQQDWRSEIQQMFQELKEKEQEIRDREQAMIERDLEQINQRLQLQKWEQQLHEREMHVVECELKLLMSTNHQERTHHHHKTPKIQKRSGQFMRSLLSATLNSNGVLSPTNANHLISSPTNFRHLISVCRDPDYHHHPALEHATSPSVSSSSPISCPSSSTIVSNSTSTMFSPSPNKSSGFHLTHNGTCTSSSTPSTPNLSRLRTLTSSGELVLSKVDDDECFPNNDVHFPLNIDECPPAVNSPTIPTKTCTSATTTLLRSRWHKPKTWSTSTSSSIKRKHGRINANNSGAKWYLENMSTININTNNNNNNDNSTTPSAISTPATDRSTRKLGSSSSSSCSTPNERSLTRALFDINSMLVAIGLGRRVPLSHPSSSTQMTVLRSTSETTANKSISSSSSSTTTTPSPSNKKQHKRTCSSPPISVLPQSTKSSAVGVRARPRYSPVRPNSLVLASARPPLPTPSSHSDSHIETSTTHSPSLLFRKQSSHPTNIITQSTPEEDDDDDDDDDRFYSAQSSKISTPMVQSIDLPCLRASQQHLLPSFILDIDSDEQKRHKTTVLPPDVLHNDSLH